MNFQAAAKESFQVLRSYDYEVELFDDEGNRVHEPETARRMFAKPENLLVAIIDDGEASAIRLYLSDSTETTAVMGLIGTMRALSTKYNMTFNVGRYDGVISPKNFSTKAAVTEQENITMNLVEGMYGTSRTSYLKLENARMIVRHSVRVDENIFGARGRNVENIYIENAVGERVLFPTNQIAPARAMTHHVDHGGSWADAIGQQITRMAQDYSNLNMASRHVAAFGQDLTEAAQGLREKCRCKMREMRRVFERMCRSKTGYKQETKRMVETANMLSETAVNEARLGEIASIMNSGDRKLDYKVIETIARVLDHALNEDRGLPIVAATSVLGRQVNKDAWEALKHGHLDLIGTPRLSGTPNFTSKTAELLFKLGEIVPKVRDDSLLNLLSYISEELPVTRDVKTARTMRAVALAAIRAAGMTLDEGVSTRAPAIREFAEWVRAHDVGTMAETHDFDDEEVDEDLELSREDVLLPKNKSDDLAREVIKPVVNDPVTGKTVEPDDGYIDRLKSLSGVTRPNYTG